MLVQARPCSQGTKLLDSRPAVALSMAMARMLRRNDTGHGIGLKKIIQLSFLLINAVYMSITCLEQERIALFNSTITVHQNSSMTVQEEIVVNSTGNQIRHGLVREFPTTYTDAQHNRYVVRFAVSAVTMNGKPAPYHQEYWRNGVRLYIGNKDTLLAPGRYTFGITYKTNRQLGFFKDHDELFWNVTGNGWRLPIEQAQATITIPGSVPANDIKIQAYTGNQGQYGTAYTGAVTGPSTIHFATTQPLLPQQGLTIVAGWPKGLVTPPGTSQQLIWLLRDNLGLLWILLGLLIVALFFLVIWRSVRAKRMTRTIIPEFEPPADMTASAVRYVARMDYDTTTFAAHIVQLAVAGYITIDYKPGFFSGTYTLNKLEKTPDDRTDQQLIKTLFGNSTSITLNKSNNPWVQQANALLQEQIAGAYGSYLTNNLGSIGIGLALSALAAASFLFVPITPFMIVAGALLALINALAPWALKSYTDEGQPVADHIAGFKMFLETTEAEQMKLMNAPDRTPELYETYLPYAIALGVEQQWTRQFASVFAKLAQAGTGYRPSWYVGSYYWGAPVFDAGAFSSNFANSFTNAIAASATPPGSKSGFGGSSGNGGGSGGGGGGGGGGGW